MRKHTPESAVLKQITDWLTANRIWHERRNTGAAVSTYKGKSRLTRFSRPGTADVMAVIDVSFRIPHMDDIDNGKLVHFQKVVWIEAKAPKGVQSDAQKAFQQEVTAAGHIYVLAFSVDDVIESLA